ncbi:tyrosine-type recombinase/integrase [Sphingopyxis sp.]|jgi:integrase|uniref:tyrosine-type recombinase/integrase n=1 Tax=Sphingopyxis sp. TaxID=1908224 RepID=UPI003F6EC1EB
MQRREVETVGEVVEAYLNQLGGKYQETRKREAWIAAKPFWSSRKITEVEEAHSAEYLKWRKRAVNTMRQELSLVRTALRWGCDNRLTDRTPKVLVPDPPETKVTHLTKAQFRTFLNGCVMPHVKLFAALAVATGARKTALLQLQWDQVDLDRGIIVLKRDEIETHADGTVQQRKNRATVPLNDQILPLLREAKESAMTDYVIEHRGLPVLDVKKGIALASQRSGIKAHPHMFRHSAAVWMAEDRVPMPEIASFLGHRDINVTTRVYAKYSPDYLKKAARSLTW